MTNAPKIDSQTSVVLINRYLVKTKTTRYTHAQKVESVQNRYFVQWRNILSDLLGMVSHPFQTYPVAAVSIASMILFLRGYEDLAHIAFVAGALTKDTAVESNDTASFSVTVASNSNRLMLMGFGHYQGGDNISAASYNSVSLTEIKAQPGSFGERAGLWGLVAPATGANTFAITGNDSWSGYGVLSIYNADQNLPTNVAGASGDGSDSSTSVTTTVDNAWVVAAFGMEPTPTMTTTSGVEDMLEQGASYQNAEMHHVAKATAGVQTVSCHHSYSARWNVAACEVKPVAAVSESPSISPSVSPSVSVSKSPSQSPSASISPSRSPSISPSLSLSFSPSLSLSKSPSVSSSASPSASESFSPSASPSLSTSIKPRVFISTFLPRISIEDEYH